MVWLVITLLLLAIGYAWLSSYTGRSAGRDTAAVRKLAPEEAPQPVAQPEPAEKQESMPITRQSDEDRIEDYLKYEAVEQQILPLLDAADVQFEAGHFVTPPGNNAWESYQAILEIVPDESVAISGLTKIKSHLITNAEQAIDAGDLAGAENWLVQLDRIQPGDDTQVELREEISRQIAAEAERKLREQEEAERAEKVRTALTQAEESWNEEELNFNKLKDLYDRSLELDPENEEAIAGLERLSDARLDQVEAWLGLGDLEQARDGIEEASAIYPDNKRISGLTLALEVSLKQQSEEEARLLAEKEALRRQQEAEELNRQQEADRLAAEDRSRRQAEEDARKQAEEQARNQAAQSAQPAPGDTARQAPQSSDSGTGTGQGVAASARARDSSDAGPDKAQNTALNEGIRAYYAGDYSRSFELLYPLAEDGVPRAQFRIGIMYQFGRSVAKNLDLAEKWFTAALPELLRLAQQGVPWAQTDLGTAYEFGIALQQDYERAAFWYGRAAERGYAGAQTNLGVLYAQGDGVPYDRAKAIFWLRKAAQQGDRVARENLGILGVEP